MTDLVNISLPTAGVTALLGYGVVFFALVLLMAVILIMGSVMRRKSATAPAAPKEAPAPAAEESRPLAPGSAGEVKLYDTDPRTAAMLMAITADELQTPLNELRFISIREIKEDDAK